MPRLHSGAQLKIERAESHIREFHSCLVRFVTSDPYRFSVEEQPDTKDVTVVLRVQKTIPVNIAPIIGDAIHNLRSALDLVVFALVAPDSEKMARRVQFPFCSGPTAFEPTIKKRFLEHAPKDALDVIRALEPYPGGKASLLVALHDLDIMDKHKLLVPVTAYSGLGYANVRSTEQPAVITRLRNVKVGPIVDGLRLIGFPAGSNIKMDNKIKPIFSMEFGDGPLKGSEIVGTLREMVSQVTDLVAALSEFTS